MTIGRSRVRGRGSGSLSAGWCGDLDSNVIALAPGASMDAHAGPDVDVVIHVPAGSGELSTVHKRRQALTLATAPANR
ncbi:MAG TPA: hypothetical protein VHT26_17505 [Trebonia sp.]|nr:hypothetical protein [Trebonia sp.]